MKKTTESFIQEALVIHKNLYIYNKVEYKGVFSPITITCKLHGDYQEIPRNHLRGKICPFCNKNFSPSPLNKCQIFAYKAKEINGEKYDYSKVTLNNIKDKITITCKKHGDFLQSAQEHLSGTQCFKCSKEAWNIKYNITSPKGINLKGWLQLCDKNATFYILECFSDNERFIKIGITKHKNIKKRYPTKKSMPYNYVVLYSNSSSPIEVWNLEKTILNKNKSSKYIPNINFKGKYECFDYSIKENLLHDTLY